MAFVTRKPFTHKGTHYRPGDPVLDFPDNFFRPESLIRTGFVVEDPNLVAPEPKKARKPKSEPVVEVEAVEEPVIVEVVEEAAPVVEVVEEVAE